MDEPPAAMGVPRAPEMAGGEAPSFAVVLRTLTSGLDPLRALDPWATRVAEDLVFEGLMAPAPARAPWAVPALADVCIADDPTQATLVDCHLRAGVTFHDGREVKASDVQYSLGWWVDPRHRTLAEDRGLGNVARVSVVDGPSRPDAGSEDPGGWIRIQFAAPEPLSLEVLTRMPVVPRALHRGRADAFARAPVGTGPARVTRLDGETLSLARVPDWDRPGRQTLGFETLTLRAEDDPAASLTALRRGEVDIFADVPRGYVRDELTRLGASRRYQAWVLSPPRFDVLLLNADTALGADAGVRAALTMTLGPAGDDARVPVDLTAPRMLDLDGLRADFEGAMDARWLARGGPVAASTRAARAGEAGARLDAAGWPLDERGVRRRDAGALRVVLTWDGAGGRASTHAANVRAAWRMLGVNSSVATAPWSYISTLFSRGDYVAGLARLRTGELADLYPLLHRAGTRNVTRVSDLQLDVALESYREATVRAGREEARAAVGARLAALRVMHVLDRPLEVLIASTRLADLIFVDDLPRLDRLRLRGG